MTQLANTPTLTSTESIHVGRKFRVEHCQAILPDGSVHEFDRVIHPGAAVIIPILDDGRIVLIRNHRYTIGRALLELPAGTLDSLETPPACAARELTEETGYVAANIVPLFSFYATPGICTEQMHMFVATGLTPGSAKPELGELLAAEHTTLADALNAIRDGRIIDGKTIAGLLYLARFSVDGTASTIPSARSNDAP